MNAHPYSFSIVIFGNVSTLSQFYVHTIICKDPRSLRCKPGFQYPSWLGY